MRVKKKADLSIELSYHADFPLIAGIDEVGRGALVGPIVAAAVMLPLDQPDLAIKLAGVNDSKQLSAAKREQFYDLILTHALSYGIGIATVEQIDQEGVLSANFSAMRMAIQKLRPYPSLILVDGDQLIPNIKGQQRTLVSGDSRALTIAAASILAKVTRDRYLLALDTLYPAYGFATNKGYGTAAHLAAIAEHGGTPVHRYSFAPLKYSN